MAPFGRMWALDNGRSSHLGDSALMLRAANSGGVRSPLSIVVSGYEVGLKVESGQFGGEDRRLDFQETLRCFQKTVLAFIFQHYPLRLWGHTAYVLRAWRFRLLLRDQISAVSLCASAPASCNASSSNLSASMCSRGRIYLNEEGVASSCQHSLILASLKSTHRLMVRSGSGHFLAMR